MFRVRATIELQTIFRVFLHATFFSRDPQLFSLGLLRAVYQETPIASFFPWLIRVPRAECSKRSVPRMELWLRGPRDLLREKRGPLLVVVVPV